MKIKIRNHGYFWIGIVIVLVMLISYLIKVPIDDGSNYNTITPLLGILIFYNPFILGIYCFIALILLYKGLRIV